MLWGARVAQWGRSLDLAAHTSLSPIRRWLTPSFVNDKKGCSRFAAARDKVYQLIAQGRWFFPGTRVSSSMKTGRHDIAEILLKVALSTKNSNSNWSIVWVISLRIQSINAIISHKPCLDHWAIHIVWCVWITFSRKFVSHNFPIYINLTVSLRNIGMWWTEKVRCTWLRTLFTVKRQTTTVVSYHFSVILTWSFSCRIFSNAIFPVTVNIYLKDFLLSLPIFW